MSDEQEPVSQDDCDPCWSKRSSGIGAFPWVCKYGHTVTKPGMPFVRLTSLEDIEYGREHEQARERAER